MIALRPPSLEQVCEQALRLPCSPAILPRLITLLGDTTNSADEIADLIMLDAPVAASTLRLANSVMYRGATPVETITEAVVRLGLRELFRLAALALVSRWDNSSARGEPGDFCRRALCIAFAAEALAEHSGQVDPQMAYTSGLVCDLGKLAMAHACHEFDNAILSRCEDAGCTWADAEKELLGYNHLEVGARLLAAWRFPEILVAAAEFSERPAHAPASARPLVAHVHAGRAVAIALGFGVGTGGFLTPLDAQFCWDWGFTPEILQQVKLVVHERARLRLQGRLTHGPLEL